MSFNEGEENSSRERKGNPESVEGEQEGEAEKKTDAGKDRKRQTSCSTSARQRGVHE